MALETPLLEKYQMQGLTMSLVSSVDVARVLREVEQLDDIFEQTTLHDPKAVLSLPHVTQQLDQLMQLNKLDLTKVADRQRLREFLTEIKDTAPILNFSFSVDPAVVFMEKLITWLRREIHPLALVTTGLQPNIGAGCVLRSSNKYFDMSLRQAFTDSESLLRDALASTVPATPAVEPVVAVAKPAEQVAAA